MKKYYILITNLLTFLALLLTTMTTAQAASKDPLQAIKNRGVLNVGVKQDVPNFGYYSAKTGTYEGMEIDVARKLAKSLGVKVNFVPVTTQTREPLMDNGQIDLLIATYTITPERQANYSISDPYYYDETGFLVRKDSGIKCMKDLNNKVIGVSQGATTKANLTAYASENKQNYRFVQLGSFPELAVSLYAKRIDAFSVDKSILSGYVSDKTVILKDGFNIQSYGIATKKSNTKITDYVNQKLATWTKDGSLTKIYKKFNLTPAKAE